MCTLLVVLPLLVWPVSPQHPLFSDGSLLPSSLNSAVQLEPHSLSESSQRAHSPLFSARVVHCFPYLWSLPAQTRIQNIIATGPTCCAGSMHSILSIPITLYAILHFVSLCLPSCMFTYQLTKVWRDHHLAFSVPVPDCAHTIHVTLRSSNSIRT